MMFQFTRSIAMAGAILAGLAFAAPAFAATLTSTGSCKVTDLAPVADACFGTIKQTPSNDSNTNLNTSTFAGTTGLFGHTDWVFLTKVDTSKKGGVTSGTNIGLTLDPDKGGSPGTWSVNPGALSVYSYVAIVLKQGSTWAAYLFEGTIPESGAFSSAAFSKSKSKSGGLSHFSIYVGPRVPEVPLPAAGFLLIGALGGLGLAARRRRGR